MAAMTLDQALEMARQEAEQGNLGQGHAICRQLMAQCPQEPRVWNLQGELQQFDQKLTEAAASFEKAVALNRDYLRAWHNLAVVLAQLGRYPESSDAFREVIRIAPQRPEGYSGLGNVLAATEQLEKAVAAYRQALALAPGYAGAYTNLGNVLLLLGSCDQAITAYQEAVRLSPAEAVLHFNLGKALFRVGQVDAALDAFRASLALDPRRPEAHANLAVVLEMKGRYEEALAGCQAALAIDPACSAAYAVMANVYGAAGQVELAEGACRESLRLHPSAEIHSNLIFALHRHPNYGARELRAELDRWNQLYAAPLQSAIPAHAHGEDPERRLRIGYVSPDFKQHPVGRFLLPVLMNHRRGGQVNAQEDSPGESGLFDIFCYSDVLITDEITAQIQSLCDHWRPIVGMSDARAAEMIRRDKIDILVDLAMHTDNNRLRLFARKPAPVQVAWLAYAGSTGLTAIDYRLSDSCLDPPETDLSIYAEKTWRLPHCFWCYQAPKEAPAVSALPALVNGYITLGSLNSFSKISDAVLDLWMKVLLAIPRARLIIHAPAGMPQDRVREHLGRAGIAGDRCTFFATSGAASYFACYHHMDIALDPFPYGGGTTTCDALFMGVPVITWRGQTAQSRAASSILANVGLPEFIGNNQKEYISIAAELAGDLPRLSEIRRNLRQRMEQSPVMNAPRFARGIKAAYRGMWREWCKESSAAKSKGHR